MKKLVALLCTAVMVLGLSSAVMANGSVTKPTPTLTGTTPSGVTVTQASADAVQKVANADVQKVLDLQKDDPAEAYTALKDLAADQELKTADGTVIDLNDYDAASAMTGMGSAEELAKLADGTLTAADIVVEDTTMTVGDFEVAADKDISDYVVLVVNPVTGEITPVVPTLVDGAFTFVAPFHPAEIQIVEKVAE